MDSFFAHRLFLFIYLFKKKHLEVPEYAKMQFHMMTLLDILGIGIGVLYPYSTKAKNRPNRHELLFLLFGGGGIREVSLIFSPIVMFYESVPIQIRCLYEYSGNRLNSAGIAQEFITISKLTLEHGVRK